MASSGQSQLLLKHTAITAVPTGRQPPPQTFPSHLSSEVSKASKSVRAAWVSPNGLPLSFHPDTVWSQELSLQEHRRLQAQSTSPESQFCKLLSVGIHNFHKPCCPQLYTICILRFGYMTLTSISNAPCIKLCHHLYDLQVPPTTTNQLIAG